MPELLSNLFIPGLVFVAVGLFSKFVPKQKLVDIIKKFELYSIPVVQKAALLTSKFLILRLGKKGADRFEEGILVTLATFIGEFLFAVAKMPLEFVKTMLEDNEKLK